MSDDVFSGFLLGLIYGFVGSYFYFKSNFDSIKVEFEQKLNKIKKNKIKKDPSNWWKYGKDPFEYGNYEEEE